MEGSQGRRGASGSKDTSARIAIIEYQIEELQKTIASLKTVSDAKSSLDRSLVSDMDERLDKIERTWQVRFEALTDARVTALVAYADQLIGQKEDNREFNRSLKISVATMIVSVIFFSIIAPLLRHFFP